MQYENPARIGKDSLSKIVITIIDKYGAENDWSNDLTPSITPQK